MEGWRGGGVEEWRSGGVEEWRSGGVGGGGILELRISDLRGEEPGCGLQFWLGALLLGVMNRFARAVFLFAAGCLMVSCETPPIGSGGFGAPPPPRVLMPMDVTVRQQPFMPMIEDVLRRSGYDPIYRGTADHLLEFTVEEGPINVVSFIRLVDHGRVVSMGEGRASGPPLLNRNRVLEDSVYMALQRFESGLMRRPGMTRPVGPTYPGYPLYR